MIVLLITTSQPVVKICLAKDRTVLAERSWESDRALGSRLLAELDTVLTEQSVTPAMIDRIAVHRGPGHYSALRTGVITATMLALAWQCELAGVQSDSVVNALHQAEGAVPITTIKPCYSSTTAYA